MIRIDRPLPDATVLLLHAFDSIVVKTAITDGQGVFLFDKLHKGVYRLCVTYLGYQSLSRQLEVPEKDTLIDLGVLNMEGVGITLKAVEVKTDKPEMVVRGDTIEFDVESFKSRENSIVEELLKKLPGIQVERDGTIKVNGEIVKRLLVDGKPFFVNDPKMATRNLTTDMIDKLQFVDGKSSWSQFTGINDGQTEKTINITIKRDRKGEYFGRVGVALGDQEHFAGSGNVFRFNDKEQLSLLVSSANVNGYQDEGTQIKMSLGGNSRVRSWNAGTNYNRDFGRNLKIGANYSMNDNLTEDWRISERQNILPDTTWYYNQNSYISNTNGTHAFNTWIEFNPDTMHVFNVSTNLGYSSGNNLQQNTYMSIDGRQQVLNSGDMHATDIIKTPNFSINFLFGKKFRKPKRSISINFDGRYNTNSRLGFNRSNNLFVDSNGGTFSDSINQRNDISSLNGSMYLSLVYIEPLVKDCYLQLTYTYSDYYNSSDKLTYTYNPSKNEYDLRNDSLSNFFVNRTFFHQTGIRILKQKIRYGYSMGLSIQFSDLNNNNISRISRIHQRAVNFFPVAGFTYRFSTKKKLSFSYSGRTQQPGAAQLQPVPDNSNPLYIQQGNPDLKPAFSNSFNINYSSLNPTSLRSFSTGINTGFIANKIVNANWFDSLGRQVSQPVNVNGSYNLNVAISTNFPLKARKTSVNTDISLSFTRDVGYINGVMGDVRNFIVIPNMSFNYGYEELFDFAVSSSVGSNWVKYAVQQKGDTWFLNCRFSLDGSIHLPLDIVIGANIDFMLNAGRSEEYGQNATMLNAFVSKSLFKHKRGLVRFHGFDLLNRNSGFSRTIGEYYIEDVQTTAMQRLYILGFSYYIKRPKGE